MDDMTLDVEVTQEDIDKGASNDCRHCPVALAVRRALGRGIMPEIEVSPIRIKITDGDMLWAAKTPEEAEHFMFRFDDPWDVGFRSPAPFRTTLMFNRITLDDNHQQED